MKKWIKVLYFPVVLMTMLIFSSATSAQMGGGGPDTTIDANAKAEAIHGLVKALREVYVFPDTGEKVANMMEEHQKHGDYNSITSAKEFAQTLTKQMDEIAHDKHLSIIYSTGVLPPEHEHEDEHGSDPGQLERLKKINYAFEEVKRLDGNIGYLKVNGFTDAERGGPTVAGAMAFLANTDALIIDLRQNGGGNPAMVALIASYLFSGQQPVHLNDLEFRKEGTKDYTLAQSWVLPYVPGQRYVDKEVYILTSHRTFSAGEEFTYDMQTQKRATIVGQTTGGGANPGSTRRISDHLMVFLPAGHAVNPITHTNWEGVGVKPDVDVPAWDALKVAEKTALEHLLSKSTDEREQGALKRAIANVDGEQPRIISLSAEVLKRFVGKYQVASVNPLPGMMTLPPLTVTADPEGLWIDLGPGKMRVWPISPTEFFLDEKPSARVEFEQDEKGQIIGVTLIEVTPDILKGPKLP